MGGGRWVRKLENDDNTIWTYYHKVTGQAKMVQNRIRATRLHQSALFNNGVMLLYYKEENFNYRKPEEAATKYQ
jgi:hypothetical protein